MPIAQFLSPDHAVVDLPAPDKAALLHELSAKAAAALGLDAAAVSGAVLAREALGSTGMGGGVAIPHARIAGLGAPFGLLARLQRGIDFAAIDGGAVDLVFLLLLPKEAPAGQLNALAAVARRLREPDVMRRLRRAADAAQLHAAMTAA